MPFLYQPIYIKNERETAPHSIPESHIWAGLLQPISLLNGQQLIHIHRQQIDGLVQGRCNSSALAMELRLACTNPSICLCKKRCNSSVLSLFCTKPSKYCFDNKFCQILSSVENWNQSAWYIVHQKLLTVMFIVIHVTCVYIDITWSQPISIYSVKHVCANDHLTYQTDFYNHLSF